MHFGPLEMALGALLVGATLLWVRHRKFHEEALVLVRRYCDRNGLQLLDSTVAFHGFRIEHWPIYLCRSYRFEYSLNRIDRYRGLFTLCGDATQSFRVDPAHLSARDVPPSEPRGNTSLLDAPGKDSD